MKIILCKDAGKLGKAGDVVKVKDGYARNFLLPRKVAYPATPLNIKRVEQLKLQRQAVEKQEKEQAQELAEKLSKHSFTIAVEVNDLEKLYGSVTEADIIKALEDEGFQMDKKTILLEKPIEELGIYEVGIKLHPQVTGKFRLWVTKK